VAVVDPERALAIGACDPSARAQVEATAFQKLFRHNDPLSNRAWRAPDALAFHRETELSPLPADGTDGRSDVG